MNENKKKDDLLFIFLILVGMGIILASLILIAIEINGAKKFCDEIKEPESSSSLDIFKTGTKISSGPQAVKEFFEKEVKELKNELKELQEFKKEIDEKNEEEEMKKLDEKEKIKIRFNKQISELQKEIDKIKNSKKEVESKIEENNRAAQARIERLRLKTLRADIIEEASKFEVFNPSQIFRIVKDDFEYDKDMDEFVHIVRDRKGKIIDEISVDAYIKEFLEDEANENLLKSKANKNSMHSNKQMGNGNKGDNGGFNPKDPAIVKNARNNNMTPEQYIRRVLIPRDKIKKRE